MENLWRDSIILIKWTVTVRRCIRCCTCACVCVCMWYVCVCVCVCVCVWMCDTVYDQMHAQCTPIPLWITESSDSGYFRTLMTCCISQHALGIFKLPHSYVGDLEDIASHEFHEWPRHCDSACSYVAHSVLNYRTWSDQYIFHNYLCDSICRTQWVLLCSTAACMPRHS